MRKFRTFIGVIILLFALSNLSTHILSALLLGLSSLIILPQSSEIIFRNLNLENRHKEIAIKVGAYLLAFLTLITTIIIEQDKKSKKLNYADKEYQRINEIILNQGLDSALNLTLNVNRIYQKNISQVLLKEKKEFAENLKIVCSEKEINSYIKSLTEEEYSQIENRIFLKKYLKDSILNRMLIYQMEKQIKGRKNYTSDVEYYLHKANKAIEKNNESKAYEYFKSAFENKKNEVISNKNYTTYVELLKKMGKKDEILPLYKKALKDLPNDYHLTLKTADYYFDLKKYNTAKSYYKKCISISDTIAVAFNNLGVCYGNLKSKKKAIYNYKKAIKIEGNGGMACKNLREATKKVARWIPYSECCDGTTSSSTGQGACSSHGGVCRSMKRAVYEYTMKCN